MQFVYYHNLNNALVAAATCNNGDQLATIELLLRHKADVNFQKERVQDLENNFWGSISRADTSVWTAMSGVT